MVDDNTLRNARHNLTAMCNHHFFRDSSIIESNPLSISSLLGVIGLFWLGHLTACAAALVEIVIGHHHNRAKEGIEPVTTVTIVFDGIVNDDCLHKRLVLLTHGRHVISQTVSYEHH